MNKTIRITLVLITYVLLAGCARAQTSPAGKVVEAYFQAIAAGDAESAAGVSCAEWQETSRDEVASFAGVKAKLENLSCRVAANNDSEATVDCSGFIVATYVDQEMRFDLSGRQYRVAQQDGKWLLCGYVQ